MRFVCAKLGIVEFVFAIGGLVVLDLNLEWPWGERAFPPVAAPFPPSSMLGGELSVLRVVLVGHPVPSPGTWQHLSPARPPAHPRPTPRPLSPKFNVAREHVLLLVLD